jgi:hypothetical protein
VELIKKLLLTLMILGAITSTVSAGTFASFNASTTNPTSTFATGSLVLSNQKSTNTACLSTAGGSTNTNTNAGCDQLFSLSVQKPGDSAFVDLTLKNEGSINASALKAAASQDCAASNAAGQSYNGTGDPCTVVQLYIQEYTSIANRTAGITTGGTCHFGGGTASVCSFSATKTINDFDTAYPASLATPLSMGTLNAGVSRYFRIYMTLPSTAGNNVQGRAATFGFTWTIDQ